MLENQLKGHADVLAASEWIGGPGNALCRHAFTLPAEPRSAQLTIVADPHSYAIHHWQLLPLPYKYEQWLVGGSFLKFRLFANGELAAMGPFRPLEDGTPVVHRYDLLKNLRKGRNVLAVHSRGERSGFALHLDITCANGQRVQITTGAHWKQLDANDIYRPICWEQPAIAQYFKGDPGPGEYFEHIDGNRYPQHWRSADYDDAHWQIAQTFGRVTEACELCRTPPYQPVRHVPKVIRQLGDGNYLVDFGRPIFGGLELAAPAGGGVVEVRLAEELQPNGHARYQARTGNCYQELWTFADGSEPLSHFGLRMFRYAEVLGWQGTFDESSLSAIGAGVAFDRQRAAFQCSDDRLKTVWDFCRNSVAYTLADVYNDCLTRERLAYEADTYVNMLSHFCTEGSYETARRTLAYLTSHPSWPCEWWQTMIPLFHEYLLHTGDLEFVRFYYPYLRDETSFHGQMENGLIRVFPKECNIDWPPNCRDGYVFGPGNAVANAYAYHDLVLLNQLARWLGDAQEAGRFAALADELKAGFNRELFDESAGLYVDSIGAAHSSFHANLFALRFGLVPADRVEPCLNYIISRGMAGSVFTASYLLETLFMHGRATEAVHLMTRDGERSWLDMLANGATVTTEAWLADKKENMSWAHPWGASPAHVIARHLFGIRPTAPGWQDYTFNPQPGGIAHGSLMFTTPRGRITAAFKRKGDHYEFAIDADFHPADNALQTSLDPSQRCKVQLQLMQ